MSSKNINTRERILTAAWQLLENKPDSGVRMSDIAKQAGISRQAVYLHFKTRSELLIATTRYIDEVKDVEARFAKCCQTDNAVARLNAFINAWGNYIPEIYAVAKALMVMKDTDEAAASAWNDRMQAVRDGCSLSIKALVDEDLLSPDYSESDATDILWVMLSIRNWEQLTLECRWSQKKYIDTMLALAHQFLGNNK